MERVLWLFVLALVTVNVTLMSQRRESLAKYQGLQKRSAVAEVKVKYDIEEERILTGIGVVPSGFPRLPEKRGEVDAVQFILLASVNDCTNSIEDEVARLNELTMQESVKITGIQGFFVDESQTQKATTFIGHLSPAPIFPMSIKNALAEFPEATTPLVLVVRSRDGKILDAHKPIPEDLAKRDAFYTRWIATLGLT